MGSKECLMKTASFCTIGSAAAAAAAAGIADALSISLFAAAFAASWFLDAVRLRRLLPPHFFAFAAIVCLCFAAADYFLLSSAWQRVLLHAIWLASAARLITRSADKDWPPLYILASIQWILAAAQPTGAIFWICFTVFIISGISSMMLFELRRPLKIADGDVNARENAEKSGARLSRGFPYRAFFMAVTGITAAATAAAIPLFFFFPRVSAPNNAPLPRDTASSFAEEVEKIELGRTGSRQQPDAIVMRVKTDAPRERLPYDLKWRGSSFDYYDGRAWTLRRREQQPIATQGRFYKLEESAMGSELLQQTFFMEETFGRKIFAAHRALAVSADAGFLQRDSSDNLFAQNPARGKAIYVAVSDTISPDVGSISEWISIPDDMRSTWLQLPGLDPRVFQLAHEITRGYGRQYDKARAIETWLRSNYDYTLMLPQIYKVPEAGDPLAVFLFDARVGHCEYFATAMTVMLRVIGIPARMTSGFLAGEYNPVGGSWTVRGKHAHTWTEAWFPPYGWIEFDATPTAESPEKPPRAHFFANLADAAGLWWRENVVNYDASRQYSVISGFFARVNHAGDRAGEFISFSTNRARDVFHLLLPQAAASVKIAALIVLFAAVFWVLVFRRRRRRISGSGAFRRSEQSAAADFYAEALIFLKARGFYPEKSQTPLEFAKSFAAHPAADALLDLTRFYNEVRFGNPAVPFPRAEARSLMRSLKIAFAAARLA